MTESHVIEILQIHVLNQLPCSSSLLQRSGFFSAASHKSNEKETDNLVEKNGGESAKQGEDAKTSDKVETSGCYSESIGDVSNL